MRLDRCHVCSDFTLVAHMRDHVRVFGNGTVSLPLVCISVSLSLSLSLSLYLSLSLSLLG